MIIRKEIEDNKTIGINFILFCLIILSSSWFSLILFTSASNDREYIGYSAIFIPLIIWLCLKIHFILEQRKMSLENIYRLLTFIPFIFFTGMIIINNEFPSGYPMFGDADFYYPLWLVSNVVLFEFSKKIYFDLPLKFVAFFILLFTAIPFAFIYT